MSVFNLTKLKSYILQAIQLLLLTSFSLGISSLSCNGVIKNNVLLSSEISEYSKKHTAIYHSITPEKDYFDTWKSGQLDEIVYSVSTFYNSLSYKEHNYSFFINPSERNETFIGINGQQINVSVLFSTSKSGYKCFDLSLENSQNVDHKNNFYVSSALSKILDLSSSQKLLVGEVASEVLFSGVVNKIGNELIESIAGDNFIILPYKYVWEIKQYTGHASFVSIMRSDYYENKAYLKNFFEIERQIGNGAHYKDFYCSDMLNLINNPYDLDDLGLDYVFEDYSKRIIITNTVAGSLLLLLSSVGLVLFVKKYKLLIQSKKTIAFSLIISNLLLFIFSTILRSSGNRIFILWEFIPSLSVLLSNVLIFIIFCLASICYSRYRIKDYFAEIICYGDVEI